MRKQNSGFTLIELVAVIVILGALAVVALPKFINLQDEAETAALKGVAGALESDAAINLASALAGDTAAVDVSQCDNLSIQGGVDSPYAIATTQGTNTSVTGAEFTCNVYKGFAAGSAELTATFQAFVVPSAP